MMAGGTKRNCFSGRKSYPSLSVSSFIQYSLSIQPIRHPLSVPDTRPGWPLRQQGRGSQIWTLIPPLLWFPILSRSWNSETHICYILLTGLFSNIHLMCPKKTVDIFIRTDAWPDTIYTFFLLRFLPSFFLDRQLRGEIYNTNRERTGIEIELAFTIWARARKGNWFINGMWFFL